MGSSDDDQNKSIDASAGGLVWVRRRNGSWWPGRILGLDELPEGCVPTPRAGTPVKLLGREDASVDWYNLEKSKRVKAFRCGEYDDCIEKAKASASLLSKKAVKYARREDAIIHALEIESAHLGKDFPDLSAHQGTQNGAKHENDESPSSFHPSEESEDINEDLNGPEDDSDSDSGPELSQSGVSFEEPDNVNTTKQESKRWRTPNDSEDDGTEGVKRMKGLEDLGMGVSASLKRKRSQSAHVHDILKRKNRRRTLTKVLECTAMVSIPVSDQQSLPNGSSLPGASDSKVSGLDSNESKKTNSVVVNNHSDSTGVSCENAASLTASDRACDASQRSKQKENEISSMLETPDNGSCERLFDVPLFAEEKNSSGLSAIISSASQKTTVGVATQSSQSSHVETVFLTNEDRNESGSTSSGAADVHNIGQKLEKGASEWQLKGKRNSRSRKTDPDDEAETYTTGVDRDIPGRSNLESPRIGGSFFPNSSSYHGKSRPLTEFQVEEFRGWSWNAPRIESHTKGSTTPDSSAPQRQLPYRQSRFTVNPKYENSDFTLKHQAMNSGLYDVAVEVKTGYRPQHVPYISLMSKLTGQPIIGHPLSIEVLEDGFCDEMLSVPECYSSSSDFRGTDSVYDQKACGRTPTKHRPSKKSRKSRKRNGLSSKKIRKLSSLTGSHRQNSQDKKLVMNKLKTPSIACVPLKIVFSRINAAFNDTMRTAPRRIAAGGK